MKNSTFETKAVSHKPVLPKEKSSWEHLADPLGKSVSLLKRALKRPSIVLHFCLSVHKISFFSQQATVDFRCTSRRHIVAKTLQNL